MNHLRKSLCFLAVSGLIFHIQFAHFSGARLFTNSNQNIAAAKETSGLLGSSISVGEFPFSFDVWSSIGWLVHYDWGLSAYVSLDENYFYYSIFGGSEVYSLYISVNISEKRGYLINGLFTQYLLSSVGPYFDGFDGKGGLFKWNSTANDWMPLVQASEDTSELVQFVAGGHQGKVALSALNNPQRMWIVFQVLEATRIKAPQNSYAFVDLENGLGVALIVQKRIDPPLHPGSAYPYPTPEAWVVNLSETANATLVLKNYGQRSIYATTQIELPPEIEFFGGVSSANITLAPSETRELTASISGKTFGIHALQVSFNYSGAESINSLPQKLGVVPRVGVTLKAPQEAFFMRSAEVNLTIENKEMIRATVVLVPALGAFADSFSITLNSSSKVTIHPRVTIEGSKLAYDAKFENILLNRSITDINLLYPEIKMLEITINSTPYYLGYYKVNSDEIYDIGVKLQNAENFSYTVALNLEDRLGKSIAQSEYFIVNKPSETVTLKPNSNETIEFRLIPLKSNNNSVNYRTLILRLMFGNFAWTSREIQFQVVPTTLPWHASLRAPEVVAVVLVAFVSGIMAGIAVLRTRSHRKLASQDQQTR